MTQHIVYLRIFEGCNYSCQHCFIPSNPKKISSDYFHEKIWDDLKKNVVFKEDDSILFQWHGGEPTLLGLNYFERVFQSMPSKWNQREVFHSIQTNLSMNDIQKWIPIFKKFKTVGVSWDQDIRFKNNQETIFWNNLDELIQSGIQPEIVITVQKKLTQKHPLHILQRFIHHGIKKIHFEKLTENGLARKNWQAIGMTHLDYSLYMIKLYHVYKYLTNNDPDIIHVSPFDGLEISLQTGSGYGCWSGVCDQYFHTIDSHGYKKGCTALTSEVDNSSVSVGENQSKRNIIWIKSENIIQDISKERDSRISSCLDCEYNKICNTGCLAANPFDGSGECSGSKLLFDDIKNSLTKYL